MGGQSTMAPQGPAQQRQGPGTTPGQANAPAGGAPAPAGAAPAPETPLVKEVIISQLVGKLPDYTEGAHILGGKWGNEQVTQTTLDQRLRDESGAYIQMVNAWREVKGSDEAFVKEFGSKDPIAVQKFADIDGEKYYEGGLDAAKQGFYGDVAGKLRQPKQPRDRVFPLMQQAAGPYQKQGKPIPADKLGEMGRRAQGLSGYYDFSLAGAAKTQLADEVWTNLARDAGAPDVATFKTANPQALDKNNTGGKDLVFELLKQKLRTGGDPLQYVNRSAGLTKPGGTLWFSPDKVNIAQDPNSGFTELMTLFALQPEWYPEGSLLLEVKTSGEGAISGARKPTAFDGLMSALWVARNQDDQTFGVTGGGAREYVAENVTWAAVKSASAQAISDNFAAELRILAERYKRDRSGQPAPNAYGTSAPTSAGEEMLRGAPQGLNPTGPAAGAYNSVFQRTQQEATSPSPVRGQPSAGLTPAAAPGGTFTQPHATR
jgi:hypothetical protein